jgi:hypothetical protein
MTLSIPATAVSMNVAEPKVFTGREILTVNAYGLCLAFPMLLAMLFVSVTSLGPTTVLVPVLTVAVTTFFLPFGFGNTHVARLVRAVRPAVNGPGNYIVQLTGHPRVRGGLRALLEDADDIGWLSLTDSALVFRGDSTDLTVPFSSIREVRRHSIGWRGLFLYGPVVVIETAGLPDLQWVKFAERSSWMLPQSRKIARDLYRSIFDRLSADQTGTGSAPGS